MLACSSNQNIATYILVKMLTESESTGESGALIAAGLSTPVDVEPCFAFQSAKEILGSVDVSTDLSALLAGNGDERNGCAAGRFAAFQLSRVKPLDAAILGSSGVDCGRDDTEADEACLGREGVVDDVLLSAVGIEEVDARRGFAVEGKMSLGHANTSAAGVLMLTCALAGASTTMW